MVPVGSLFLKKITGKISLGQNWFNNEADNNEHFGCINGLKSQFKIKTILMQTKGGNN